MTNRDWVWLVSLAIAWLNVAVLAVRLRREQKHYRSLHDAFGRECAAHKATREAKIVQVRSDPRVPKNTMLIFAPGDVQ